jgi:hypothetical protein
LFCSGYAEPKEAFMPWTTTTPFLIWAVVFLALTVSYFIIRVRDRLTALLLLVIYILTNLYFMLVVNFAIISYWLRFLPAVVLIIVLLRLLDRFHRKPWLPTSQAQRNLLLGLVVLVVALGWVNFRVLGSYTYAKEPVKPVMLVFPAQTGMYVVANGGGSINGVGMNNLVRDWLGRPNGNPQALTYGVDFMEITARGMLAESLLSNDRNAYEGWDEPIYAPCPGTVVEVVNGQPDRAPLAVLDGFELGNYVVIQCFEYYITISNLREFQSPVQVGETLWFNRIIGYMGTSGAPSLPHVHVHATVGGYGLDATPVPIEFEEKFRVRNAVYVR